MRWVVAATVALALTTASTARATLVDRIVAVVGKRPITLSQLETRMRPFEQRFRTILSDRAQRTVAEAELRRETLRRMVDEELEAREAQRIGLAATDAEVDQAISNIAVNASTSEKEILAEARRQGMTAAEYRAEVKRQILEAKLIQVTVRARVTLPAGASPERMASALEEGRRKWLDELRAETPIVIKL